MQRRAIIGLGLATTIGLTPGGQRRAAASGAPHPIAAVVDQAIAPVMREHDIPGMAVAITVDGQRHFINYGVASRETNRPVTEHTLFELGSVSKTFTGTLASYAQVLGRMSLDDHPGGYMPQLRGSALDRASLLHLGTYTAGGLPLQFPAEVRDQERMLAYFRQWQPEAAPGTQRRYSNPSIGLFGYIAGLAMGGGFERALQTELLPRLGLDHSHLHVPEREMNNYAWGHDLAGRPIRVGPGVFDAEAYGVKSSAADMIRFLEVNIQPEKLDDTTRRAIEGAHVGRFGIGGMQQALGWEHYAFPATLEQLLAGNSRTMSLDAHPATALTLQDRPSGPRLYNKTGSTNGFGCYVAFVPARRIGLIMLANRSFPISDRIRAAYAILEKLTSAAG